jgi:hypothetical protein
VAGMVRSPVRKMSKLAGAGRREASCKWEASSWVRNR